tara:strand:- start:378 stop:578 length:201 start_codon:yes stop_codon:yes gene_type:complete
MKYKGKSKYKYVSQQELNGELVWRGVFFKNGSGNGKTFKTEREAALYVDKKLIENGKEPVNILVHK